LSNVYVYETYSLEVNSRTFLAWLSLVAYERLNFYIDVFQYICMTQVIVISI